MKEEREKDKFSRDPKIKPTKREKRADRHSARDIERRAVRGDIEDLDEDMYDSYDAR